MKNRSVALLFALALAAPLAARARGSFVEQARAMIGSQPPPADLSGLSPQRRKIVETAASYIGKVADVPGDDGNKVGWQTLVDIYRTAMAMPQAWPNGPLLKQLKEPSGGRKLTVQPVAWCGIFATFSVRRAGFTHIKWVGGAGPVGGGKATPASKATWGQIQPGDIVVIKDVDPKNPLVHHALVEKVDLAAGTIQTIDGNMVMQQIHRKLRNLSQVNYFYNTMNDGAGKPQATASKSAPAKKPARARW